MLDEIPGVGPVTRKKLIRAFGSLQGLRQAPEAEIAKIVGDVRAKAIHSAVAS
jgi:excinuclease ABC subunit C